MNAFGDRRGVRVTEETAVAPIRRAATMSDPESPMTAERSKRISGKSRWAGGSWPG